MTLQPATILHSMPKPLPVTPPAKRTRPRMAVAQKAPVTYFQGFGPLTRLTCSFGEVPAQVLRKRDRVRTATGEFLEIQRVDHLVLDEGYMNMHPMAQPVCIKAGSLGQGLPENDITFAPHQSFRTPNQMPGIPREMRAVDALDRPNITRKRETMMTYTRIYLGRAATVLTEGILVDIPA